MFGNGVQWRNDDVKSAHIAWLFSTNDCTDDGLVVRGCVDLAVYYYYYVGVNWEVTKHLQTSGNKLEAEFIGKYILEGSWQFNDKLKQENTKSARRIPF